MRRYLRQEELELQAMEIKIAYPPSAKNVFGEVLSVTLTVNAITRWAGLGRGYKGEIPVEIYAQSAYKLYDLTRVSIHERKSFPYIAELQPDDPNLSIGGTEKFYVLCVLCAVAPFHHDYSWKKPTMITAIGVVPS